MVIMMRAGMREWRGLHTIPLNLVIGEMVGKIVRMSKSLNGYIWIEVKVWMTWDHGSHA
jgi:hypothetical protein